MINFENLDGFVVDIRTDDDCNYTLEDILSGDDKLCKLMLKMPLETKQLFITEYFTTTYKQVFIKQVNVLQVCEEELYTYDDIESCNKAINTLNKTITELRKLNEQGLQYATERDNKIEELEDFIGDKAIEILKLEDQLETLTQELLKAQQVIEYKDGLLKEYADKLNKIKEIINNER